MNPCGVANRSTTIAGDLSSSDVSLQVAVTDKHLAFETWWEEASAQHEQEAQRKQSPVASRGVKLRKALPGTSFLQLKLRSPFQRKPSMRKIEAAKKPRSSSSCDKRCVAYGLFLSEEM